MNSKKVFHFSEENGGAVPELHSEEFDEMQKKADEEENIKHKKKEIDYENVAVPEIHFRRKKRRNSV